MLQLGFVFEDAVRALSKHADRLTIPALPATVYLMQVDVINHYRYALDHYLTMPLDSPCLQNSSLGTPYQKWAHVNNDNFAMLSFAVHNLLRYTSRLLHESELLALRDSERFKDKTRLSNSYTNPICEIHFRGKAIGITVQPDHRLSITPVRAKRRRTPLIYRQNPGGPPLYFRIVQGADGKKREKPIGLEEVKLATATVRSRSINILDRTRLIALRKQGHKEVAELRKRNSAFKQACDRFYRSRAVTEPFERLNECYWT